MNAKTLFAAAALLALGLTSNAYAAPANAVADDSSVSVRISVADLDLGRASGAKVALQRIQRAADGICGGKPDIRFPVELAAYRACTKMTVDRTVTSLGAPVVMALNGAPNPTLALAAAPALAHRSK
ncbi:MAG TPA: UrcA family protein [Caulobacteraceae bacterium]|jgi:UrcA family protein